MTHVSAAAQALALALLCSAGTAYATYTHAYFAAERVIREELRVQARRAEIGQLVWQAKVMRSSV